MAGKPDLAGVTVIICCYNSAARLPETLRHLATQQVNSIPWEIVLVNNASTDDTVHVARACWVSLNVPCPLRVVEEMKPGLSYARAKGVSEAMYDVIIFCDDDNWLAENFVQCAWEAISGSPNIGAVCAEGVPATEGTFPAWFPSYSGGYAVGRPAERSGDVTHLMALTGAALVSRKSLFQAAYEVPASLTDREGQAMTSGGDSEFTMRLVLMGYRLYFHERLSFTHFIPAARLTEDYRDRLFAGFKMAAPILECYKFQVAVKMNSVFENGWLFIKCLVRHLILKLVPVKRWNRELNARWIYQLTGWQSGEIPDAARQIRMFYRRYC